MIHKCEYCKSNVSLSQDHLNCPNCGATTQINPYLFRFEEVIVPYSKNDNLIHRAAHALRESGMEIYYLHAEDRAAYILRFTDDPELKSKFRELSR